MDIRTAQSIINARKRILDNIKALKNRKSDIEFVLTYVKSSDYIKIGTQYAYRQVLVGDLIKKEYEQRLINVQEEIEITNTTLHNHELQYGKL